MCNKSAQALREEFFGRQLVDSGQMAAYDRVGYDAEKPVFFPTNPFGFRVEGGFTGHVYGASFDPVAPLYLQPYYKGVLPIKEQPRLEIPQPYTEPVVF